jgi:hypothetical protein
LVPLIVGVVTFGSVIKYIELSHGRDIGFHGLRLVAPLQEGFFEFFPHNLKFLKLLTWSHLYFLAYLFLMSVLLLPLLMRLARRTPSNSVPPAWVAYLPALPMAALLMAFSGFWPYMPNLIHDWANFGYFTLCFAIGAGIAVWPGFETRLRGEAPRLAIVMLAAFAGMMWVGESTPGRLFVGVLGWSAVGTSLGFAARLNPPEWPLANYLNEAMLPVFIVHHAPLLLIGVAVLPLAVSVWVKVAVMSIGATAISLAAYHWLIRPWPPMRFLMGMNPKPANAATTTQLPAGAAKAPVG